MLPWGNLGFIVIIRIMFDKAAQGRQKTSYAGIGFSQANVMVGPVQIDIAMDAIKKREIPHAASLIHESTRRG